MSKFLIIAVSFFLVNVVYAGKDDDGLGETPPKSKRVPVNVQGWPCDKIREEALRALYLSPENMALFREKCGRPKDPSAKPSDSENKDS